MLTEEHLQLRLKLSFSWLFYDTINGRIFLLQVNNMHPVYRTQHKYFPACLLPDTRAVWTGSGCRRKPAQLRSFPKRCQKVRAALLDAEFCHRGPEISEMENTATHSSAEMQKATP